MPRGGTQPEGQVYRHGARWVRRGICEWLNEAETSAIAAFARGLRADQTAVAAALREPWSNGQTEGQINRRKTLKRQMNGRAIINLLKARLIAAP